MANVDKPNGARPVMMLDGSPYNGLVNHYIADGSGSNIFIGDWVILDDDGKIDVAAAGSLHLIGVCVGFNPAQQAQTDGISDHALSTGAIALERSYYDASADGEKLIAVAPGDRVLFEMQEDNVDGSTMAFTVVGNNVDILATAGDTTRGISLQEIDRSTATAATAQLRIVRPVNRPDNALTASSRWLVTMNEGHFQMIDDGGTKEGGEGI